jgi:WhiB family redox-sensing transcriptional regulator
VMPHSTATAPACRGADPSLFHSDLPGGANARAIAQAKNICGLCDLQADCLRFAMRFPDDEQWGVWGGLDAASRRALRAADPEAWPVEASSLNAYLPARVEVYGRGGGKNVHENVDWATVDLDDRVVDLMDRYQDVTEVGYALTDESGIVIDVNEVAA